MTLHNVSETDMDAREKAMATIRAEHIALGTVVQVLRDLLARIAAQRMEADFALLSAALYYIDEFPEQVHHSKEDEHIFRAIRGRSARFNAVLDELQSEHVRSAQMVTLLQCALVRYQGGAPDGLERLRAAVEAYSAMLEEHMRKEEELLAEAGDSLTADDWSEIAVAFAANEDPLLGSRHRGEFRRLHARIVNLLPRKMRLPQGQA